MPKSKFHQPPNVFIEAIRLTTRNLKYSSEFYQEVLGFKILKEDKASISLTADGEKEILIIDEEKKARPKGKRNLGLYHFAILLPPGKHLGALISHIYKFDSPIITGASDHGISKAIYLEDPDGHGIEVYQDTPPETWTWEYGRIMEKTEKLNTKKLMKEAEDHEWTELPKNSMIGHIHLSVKDLNEAEKYYTELIGMSLVMEYPDQAKFFSSGGYHHHIAVNTWSKKKNSDDKIDENQVGMKYFVLLFPNEWKREHVVNQLKKNGYPVEPLNHSTDLYTWDPIKNKIILRLYRS